MLTISANYPCSWTTYGTKALPQLLQQMYDRSEQWFYALHTQHQSCTLKLMHNYCVYRDTDNKQQNQHKLARHQILADSAKLVSLKPHPFRLIFPCRSMMLLIDLWVLSAKISARNVAWLHTRSMTKPHCSRCNFMSASIKQIHAISYVSFLSK